MLKHVAEKTQYFQLRTWLRIGFAEFALYSLMYRDDKGSGPTRCPYFRHRLNPMRLCGNE